MKHFLPVIAISVGILTLTPNLATAQIELASQSITTTMTKRANKICDGVLPTWIKSPSGMRDKSVRRLVVECYLSQARLPLIGAKAVTLNTAVILDEVPSTLLEKATGLSFHIYTAIAGADIRVRENSNLRNVNND